MFLCMALDDLAARQRMTACARLCCLVQEVKGMRAEGCDCEEWDRHSTLTSRRPQNLNRLEQPGAPTGNPLHLNALTPPAKNGGGGGGQGSF